MTVTNPILIRIISMLHTVIYRITDGRVGGKRMGAAPVLLLTTVGRSSGKVRTAPLIYLDDGDAFVVVASYAGNPRLPHWWRNLEKDPRATVRVGARVFEVEARRAGPEEEADLWPRLDEIFEGYAVYRSRARREIPVVRLERR